MRRLLTGLALAGIVGAVAAESALLEALAALVGVVSGAAGLAWAWRDRSRKRERERLEVELLRERLHDQRKDGDNDDRAVTMEPKQRSGKAKAIGISGAIGTLVVSAVFLLAAERTFTYEAGYSDHASDTGGRTMYGVTERVARAHGYRGPMRALPKEMAERIAYVAYWQVQRLDEVAAIDEALAFELFDTGYNMGPRTAGRMVQRCVNAFNRGGRDWPDVSVDGQIGPATLGALRSLYGFRKDAGALMMKCTNGLQAARYVRLSEGRKANEAFTVGWFRHRVE